MKIQAYTLNLLRVIKFYSPYSDVLFFVYFSVLQASVFGFDKHRFSCAQWCFIEYKYYLHENETNLINY